MFRVFILFMLAGFSSTGLAREPLIALDPDNSAIYHDSQEHWTERAHYHPHGKAIEGVPISKINKKWCAANLLRKYDLPAEAGVADSVGFQVENLEIGNFRKAKASVGIARNCSDDDTHLFILFTAKNRKMQRVLHLEEFQNHYPIDGIEILFISPVSTKELIVWWCDGCDVSSQLDWSNDKFEWLASEEMGE